MTSFTELEDLEKAHDINNCSVCGREASINFSTSSLDNIRKYGVNCRWYDCANKLPSIYLFPSIAAAIWNHDNPAQKESKQIKHLKDLQANADKRIDELEAEAVQQQLKIDFYVRQEERHG